MEEYPKILEAYSATIIGEITIKCVVVNDSSQEQNFRDQYKQHSIRGRSLTEEEKAQGQNLVLPKEEQNIPLIECLDLSLSWFARDIDEFHFSNLTQTIAVTKSAFMDSVIKLYPQLDNHRFNYFHTTILDKLVDDKYLYLKENLYGITINGIIFRKQGGYDAQIASLDVDRNLRSFLDQQPGRLNKLTFWLAVATSVLSLIEIVKLVHEWH